MFNIIFDMDGTLLDTQRMAVLAWEYAGNQQGIAGMGFHVPKICGLDETGWTAYITKEFPNIDVESFKLDRIKYLNEKGIISLKSGAKLLLDFLRENKIKMGLASSSSRDTVFYRLDAVGITDYFDIIISNDDVAESKPAPDCFLLAAQKLNASPENCFVFEDTNLGIMAGKAAGMKPIGVKDIAEFDDKTKKLMYSYIESLEDAIDILKLNMVK